MSDARPALSNLMVCLALSLQDQQPGLFEAVGRPVADPGEDVFAYDVLSALTGRDFDACWDALERASETGLIETGGTFQKAYLTSEGFSLVDKSHVDVLDMCRRHALRLDEIQSRSLVDLIEAIPRPQAISGSGSPDVSLDVDGGASNLDEDLDDDVETVVPARRVRP